MLLNQQPYMTISYNKRILLIYPPDDPEVKKRGFNYSMGECQPLGLSYIAASLEAHGYKIKIVDAKAETLSIDDIIRRIVAFNPAIIGISVSTVDFCITVSLCRRIKANIDCPLIIGGRHVSALPEETIKESCFDYGAIGEGERTMVELADAISEGDIQKIPQIKGIVFRNGSEIIRTSPREYIEDLDMLPFPARHLFPSPTKHPYLHYNKSLLVATIITSRGCPYQCTFCDRSVFGNRVRMRSIKNIIDEIEMLIRDYGIREINIIDDIFPLHQERVKEFCRELTARKLKISWICGARVDSITPEILKTMKRSGCWMIGYGIESGSQEILDRVKKNITLKKIKQAVKWAKQAGLCTAGTFMFGLPGEDLTTIRDTIMFAKQLSLDRIVFAIFLPLPGSELYKELLQNGGLKRDIECYNHYNYYFPDKLPFISEDLNMDILRSYRKKAILSFYLNPLYIAKLLLIYRGFKGLPMRIRTLIKTIL